MDRMYLVLLPLLRGNLGVFWQMHPGQYAFCLMLSYLTFLILSIILYSCHVVLVHEYQLGESISMGACGVSYSADGDMSRATTACWCL